MCPSSPEDDPSPPGHTSRAERSRIQVELSVEAFVFGYHFIPRGFTAPIGGHAPQDARHGAVGAFEGVIDVLSLANAGLKILDVVDGAFLVNAARVAASPAGLLTANADLATVVRVNRA